MVYGLKVVFGLWILDLNFNEINDEKNFQVFADEANRYQINSIFTLILLLIMRAFDSCRESTFLVRFCSILL